MAAYRGVYDSRHLQTDCQEPGSAPVPYTLGNREWATFFTRLSRYQKGKTNLDFTETRDSVWQWHQLGHIQISTPLQTNNHTSTPPL